MRLVGHFLLSYFSVPFLLLDAARYGTVELRRVYVLTQSEAAESCFQVPRAQVGHTQRTMEFHLYSLICTLQWCTHSCTPFGARCQQELTFTELGPWMGVSQSVGTVQSLVQVVCLFVLKHGPT